MSDRIVYVHPEHTSDTVTIITPKMLDAVLAEGWEIKETKKQKISGRGVDVYHLYKPSKERGLVLGGNGIPGPKDGMGLAVSQHHGGQDARGLTVAPSNNSFLGTSDFHGMPGLKIANSMVIQHAYSLGVDSANRGEPEANCPWPNGVGRTQWLKGYHAGMTNGAPGAASEADTKYAHEAGKLAAQGDADLEVHCPYPNGTPHYHAWIRGFQEAGGRIES